MENKNNPYYALNSETLEIIEDYMSRDSKAKGNKGESSRGILDHLLNDDTYALTGSRYFNNNETLPDGTDWDFFSQYSIEKEEWLRSKGFLQLYSKEAIYEDSDVIKVYHREADDNSSPIDIQLVNDFNLRLTIRTIMKQNSFMQDIPKHLRSQVWNVAYQSAMLPSPIQDLINNLN